MSFLGTHDQFAHAMFIRPVSDEYKLNHLSTDVTKINHIFGQHVIELLRLINGVPSQKL